MNVLQPILDFLLKVFNLRPTQLTIALLTIGLGVSLGFNYQQGQSIREERRENKKEIDSLRTAFIQQTIAFSNKETNLYKDFYEKLIKISRENDSKLDSLKNNKK